MIRLASLLSITVLIAACGGAGQVEFAYGYEAGDHLFYDVTLEQHLITTIDLQSAPALLGGSDLPGSADVLIRSVGQVVYDVAAGPDEGTFAITATTTYTETTISGEVDGESIDSLDAVPEGLAPNLDPQTVTIVIDGNGVVLSSTADETNPLALLDNPIGIGTSVGFDPLNGHLGPEFQTGSLAEGDTWTTTSSAAVLSATVETTTAHVLSTLEGNLASIDTTYSNDGFTLSLGDLLQLFFGGSADLTDGTQSGDLPSTVTGSGFDLTISGSPLEGRGTSVFDTAAGVLMSYEASATIPAMISVAFPDDTTGEPVEGSIDLVMEVSVTAILTGE